MNPFSDPTYLLPPLLAAVFSGALCILVARKAARNTANRYFALFLLGITGWSALILFMRASADTSEALQWERWVLPVMLATSPAFFLFTRQYTRVGYGTFLKLGVLLFAVITVALSSLDLLLEGMELRSYGFNPIFTPYFYGLALWAYIWIAGGIWTLFRAYRASQVHEERNRLFLICLATSFPIMGTLGDILPFTYPTSILGNLVFATITTVAMRKYQLMDVGLVVRKGTAYLTVSTFIAVPYVVVIFVVTQAFQEGQLQSFVYIMFLFVLALMLQPLWSRAQLRVDKAFFRRRWDGLQAMQEFSRRTHSVGDLQQSANELVDLIGSAAAVDGATLLLPTESDDFTAAASWGKPELAELRLLKRSPLTGWIDREKRPLDLRLLDIDPTLQALDDLQKDHLRSSGATLLVPLIMRDRLVGVLAVGAKLSETPFSSDELSLLTLMASQAAVVLDDARLYRGLSVQLEKDRARLEAFRSAASNLALDEDPENALQELVNTARTIVGAEQGALIVWDTQLQVIRSVISTPLYREREQINKMLHDPEFARIVSAGENPVRLDAIYPPRVSNNSGGPNSGISDQVEPETGIPGGIKSLLGMPMSVNGHLRSALILTNKIHGSDFTEDDERLAGLFSVVARVLLENVELFDTVTREKNTLDAILFSMTEGLVVFGTDTKIAWWNNAMTLFTGIPAHKALGNTFRQAMGPNEQDLKDPSVLEMLDQAIAGSVTESPTIELTLNRSPRIELVAKLFAIPTDAGTSLTGLLVRDVTQERDLEERRNSFISIASHELRTPVTTIIGFAEILLTREVPAATRQKWLQTIHQDGIRLANIVDDLLSISQVQSGKMVTRLDMLPINPSIEETLALVGPMSNTHEITQDIPDDLPDMWMDGAKFIQVLTNLLSNAIKYSPEGGQITVSARHQPEHRRVVICVEDRGIGIASESLETLFDSFQREHRAETEGIRGAGLGLYIVKSFVGLMGGSVWVESEINRGSKFYFSLLDYCPDPQVEPVLTSSADGESSPGGENILEEAYDDHAPGNGTYGSQAHINTIR